jgi:N-acetylmuramoyl-L-alanine amidase
MATRIMIDAGHGGFDNGAVYEGRTEKNDNLNLALALGDVLENLGYEVVYTRTTDVYDSPSQKARLGNESGADYFISLHRNAAEYPGQYNGVQTLVYDTSGIAYDMAQNINTELEKLGFKNINVEERKNLAVLRQTDMPAVLIETGFIDSDYDNYLYDYNFEQIAEAIGRAVNETLT